MDDEFAIIRSADGVWYVSDPASAPPVGFTAFFRARGSLAIAEGHVRELNEMEESAEPEAIQRKIAGLRG